MARGAKKLFRNIKFPSFGTFSVQLFSIFCIILVFYTSILPEIFSDEGFPALVKLFFYFQASRLKGQGPHPHQVDELLKKNAFENIAKYSRGGVPTFALVATASNTMQVAVAFYVSLFTRAIIQKYKNGLVKTSIALMLTALSMVPMYFALRQISLYLFNIGYATYFFEDENEFASVASMHLCVTYAIAGSLFSFQLLEDNQHVTKENKQGRRESKTTNIYTAFDESAGRQCLFILCFLFLLFRFFITPNAIMFIGTLVIGHDKNILHKTQELNPSSFAAIASITHTVLVASGIVVCNVLKNLIKKVNTPRVRKLLQTVILILTAIILSYFIHQWLTFTASNNIQFVARYQKAFFVSKNSPEAVFVPGSCMILAFISGVLITEVSSTSKEEENNRMATIRTKKQQEQPTVDKEIKEENTIRRRKRKKRKSISAISTNKEKELSVQSQKRGDTLVIPVVLIIVAICSSLSFTNPTFLNATLLRVRNLFSINHIVEDTWVYFYDNYTKEELMYMTLPIMFLTEIPLYFFTLLDYLKLKSIDEKRVKYSKLDHKRPRLYPSNEELKKAFKVHCQNFFGVYCTIHLISTTIGNSNGHFPYKMTRELPDYWFLEFIGITILSDQLFYWIHRIVHLPIFYKHLHKMHHEWIYTIAMAHHYMSVGEAILFMIPPMLPPLLFKTHIAVMWLFTLWVQLNTILGHSAYCIPYLCKLKWLPFLQPTYHDLHHLRFTVNYGAMYTFTDMMYGTYKYENIIYIDGVEPELVEKKSKNSKDPWASKEVMENASGGKYSYISVPSAPCSSD